MPLSLSAVVDDDDDDLQDLMVSFALSLDGETISTCSDEPDEEGVSQCDITMDAGVFDIVAEVKTQA